MLPGKRVIQAIGLIPGVGVAFKVFNILELGLFAWLVFEAADNFVIKWMSGLNQTQYCTSVVPGLFFKDRTRKGFLSHGHGYENLWAAGKDADPYTNVGWSTLNGGEISKTPDIPPGRWRVIWTCNGGSFKKSGGIEQVTIGVRLTVQRISGTEIVIEKFGANFVDPVPEDGAIGAVSAEYTGEDWFNAKFEQVLIVSGLSGQIEIDTEFAAAVLPG